MEDAYEITTRRAEGGLVGQALAAESGRAEALAKALLDKMDAGDGWTWRDSKHLWWYPSRLAVRLTPREDGPESTGLRADICVVTGAAVTPELRRWMSNLNAQATGWWWWLTVDGDLYVSIECITEPQVWWWPLVLLDVLPYAVTVAESMADELARAANGRVAVQEHPERGLRQSLDGWINGCRLGARDFTASLDLWLFDAELSRMNSALRVICGSLRHELFRPLEARIHDEDGEPRVFLSRHWHPQQGWGWQLATVTGLVPSTSAGTDHLQQVAADLNARQAQEDTPINRFGGWSYVEGAGLVHLSFIPAFILDQVVYVASTSIGDVAALMLDVLRRNSLFRLLGDLVR